MSARRVLVVAAHPDDEVLGPGGTLARHACDGDDVHVVILAEGATSRDDTRDTKTRADELAALKAASRHAARALGLAPPNFAGFPDNRMDEVPLLDVIKVVESHIADIRPQTVYTHFADDLNIDHQITFQATLTACRPLPGACVREVLAFETLSATEYQFASGRRPFSPTMFVDVSDTLPLKHKALQAYDREMRAFPHPRSYEAVDALARLRGASAGLAAAEAFHVVRLTR